MVKVTESGMNRESWASSTILQSLTFITSIVSEKIALLEFLPRADGRPDSLTLIITYTPTDMY